MSLHELLAKMAGLGALAVTGGPLGQAILEAAAAAAEVEVWQVKIVALLGEGIQADMDRYIAVATALAHTSPLFENNVAIDAARQVALDRVAGGETLIPSDPRKWAAEVFNVALINTSIPSSFPRDGYHFLVLFDNWQNEAERLWNAEGAIR